LQLEFVDIQETLHVAERLAELQREMTELDAMESGSHRLVFVLAISSNCGGLHIECRPQALTVSPEEESRNIAAESKAAYVRRLRENLATVRCVPRGPPECVCVKALGFAAPPKKRRIGDGC
jgi:hypothetical protein